MRDLIDRQAAIEKRSPQEKLIIAKTLIESVLDELPSAQPEIIRCRNCVYGEQDADGWWFCGSLGCQIGDRDGSGFCADAERRTDD